MSHRQEEARTERDLSLPEQGDVRSRRCSPRPYNDSPRWVVGGHWGQDDMRSCNGSACGASTSPRGWSLQNGRSNALAFRGNTRVAVTFAGHLHPTPPWVPPRSAHDHPRPLGDRLSRSVHPARVLRADRRAAWGRCRSRAPRPVAPWPGDPGSPAPRRVARAQRRGGTAPLRRRGPTRSEPSGSPDRHHGLFVGDALPINVIAAKRAVCS